MSDLPKGARLALIEHKDSFLKRELPIVDRLASESHSDYLNTIIKIENIFSRFLFASVFGQWNVILNITLFGVTEFNKQASLQKKRGLNEYSKDIVEIHETASKLSDLLRLSELNGERLGCCAGLDVSGISFLVGAAQNICDHEKKYRFDHWLKPEIEKLRSYDLKYWPTVTDIIDELARQAGEAEMYIIDGELPKQIHKSNAFLKYFFENLFEEVERKRISAEIYEMADSEWCWFFNTAFGEQSVDEYDIKNFRKGNKALFLKG